MKKSFDFLSYIFSKPQNAKRSSKRAKGRQAKLEELEGREMLDGALGSIFAGAMMPDDNNDDIVVVAPPDFTKIVHVSSDAVSVGPQSAAAPQAAGETEEIQKGPS
ncbi:MAG: hypothetical protein FWG73_08725, partial [Planctomycetaceae bacterium]|nr:hypothetical protein [Planctomycetaceae bacterium]